MNRIIRPSFGSGIGLSLTVSAFLLMATLALGYDLLTAFVASLLAGMACSFSILPLKATVSINDDKLEIDYCGITSFSEDLRNLTAKPSGKFLFRDDPKYGLNKLFRGTRLMGFHVGWYVLNDGSLAFVCVSRKKRARSIVTPDGVRLVVDPGVARAISAMAA